MAVILALGSLIPVLIGFIANGDFPQMLIKLPRLMILQAFKYRYALMAASLSLFLIAILVNSNNGSTSVTFFVVIGILLVVLAFSAFFAVPTMIFPVILKRSQWVSVKEANKALLPDDEVLGLEINGDARAYPLKWIVRAHVVQDNVGGEPVAMTYCGLSHLGRAFQAEYDGKPMQLQVVVQIENNLVLYDANNKHLIQQIDGAINFGKKQGQALMQHPTRIMSWSAWQGLFPQTKVFYNPPHGLQDRAVRQLLSVLLKQHYNPKKPQPIFPTIERFDPRLPAKSYVVGVEVKGEHKAYSLDYLYKNIIVNDMVNGFPLAIICDKTHDIIDVFERTQNGQVLTFQAGTSPETFTMVDKETGSTWNIKGEAITGVQQGQHLQAYPHASRVFWMVWYNYYPNTRVMC